MKVNEWIIEPTRKFFGSSKASAKLQIGEWEIYQNVKVFHVFWIRVKVYGLEITVYQKAER